MATNGPETFAALGLRAEIVDALTRLGKHTPVEHERIYTAAQAA